MLRVRFFCSSFSFASLSLCFVLIFPVIVRFCVSPSSALPRQKFQSDFSTVCHHPYSWLFSFIISISWLFILFHITFFFFLSLCLVCVHIFFITFRLSIFIFFTGEEKIIECFIVYAVFALQQMRNTHYHTHIHPYRAGMGWHEFIQSGSLT